MALDKEDIMALIAILQKGLEDEEPSDTSTNTQAKKTKKKSSPVRKKRNTKTSVNKFDSMSEKDMHKADVEIDKKLQKYAPSKRTRKFSLVTVKCRACGKEESVNPSLVDSKERYKCNQCCVSGG